MKAAVKCLLPKQGLGGWEGSVVWFDLDGHFDVLRLLRLLQAHIYEYEGKHSNLARSSMCLCNACLAFRFEACAVLKVFKLSVDWLNTLIVCYV